MGEPRDPEQGDAGAPDDEVTASVVRRMLTPLRDFLDTEAAGGSLLVGASAVALVWANSPWRASYVRFWHHVVTVGSGSHALHLDLQHWVSDGLMTVFFLVVGLEIKREMTSGHLAGRRAATLPAAAAIGGMAIPALLYLVIAGGTAPKGWGVPMATDIALAVGVLALAGGSAPASLRAFLLGLAVVDDIGAIVVIAVFYSAGVSFGWLAGAIAGVLVTVLLRTVGVPYTLVYVVVGAFIWYALHEAGIHPTIAGVVMGLLAPVDRIPALEHRLHPWSSYVIVPLFALANAGIVVSTASMRAAWSSPIFWGITAGLVLGKPLGVLLAARLTVKSGAADPPDGTTRRQLLGAGNAAGIGFTVALFIAELAFVDHGIPNELQLADAKMAILLASVVSGVLAFLVLRQRSRDAVTKLS
jgi:NhaA family Na+:H+ antiporter